jgi:hypothetical protein
MGTSKNRFFRILSIKKSGFILYCVHKGTSNKMVFRSSLIKRKIFLQPNPYFSVIIMKCGILF